MESFVGLSAKGRLSDIFDPDNGGTIGVMDIAAGIRRHRKRLSNDSNVLMIFDAIDVNTYMPKWTSIFVISQFIV